ncbi:MAG: DHHA1 domain-containing protein [Candidatus Micrarchaeia archaeon]
MLSYILSAKKVEKNTFHFAITSKGNAVIKTNRELSPGSWFDISGEVLKIDEDTFEIHPNKIEIVQKPEKNEMKSILNFIKEKSKPKNTKFFFDNQDMEMLSSSIYEAAKYIKEACVLKRPIIIRYDTDQDGLTGAVSLFYALKDHYNIKFVPQSFPFYNRLDFEEDKRYIENLEAKHLPPVLVTVDFGFNPESEEAYRLAKDYGFSILVIDHHPPQKPAIKELFEAIVSPWLFNIKNPSSYTAGLLATEIAKRIGNINEKTADKLIRISLTADRSKIYNPSKYDLKDAEAVGYFIGTSAYENNIVQYAKAIEDEEMLDFAYAQSQEKIQTFLEKAKNTTKSKTINGITFFFVDVTKYIKKGSYPNKGLAANIMADLLGNRKTPTVTIVYTGRNISFRLNQAALEFGLDLSKAISKLKSEMLNGIESGGGHKAAAALRLKQGYLKEALDKIVHYIAEQNPK